MKLVNRPASILSDTTRAIMVTLPVMLAAPLSHADTMDVEVPKYVLHYSPSSLTTVEGREALRRRIAYAAHLVCSQWDELVQMSQYHSCVRQAIDRAVASVEELRVVQTQTEVHAE